MSPSVHIPQAIGQIQLQSLGHRQSLTVTLNGSFQNVKRKKSIELSKGEALVQYT
jgi:hypothetical protein